MRLTVTDVPSHINFSPFSTGALSNQACSLFWLAEQVGMHAHTLTGRKANFLARTPAPMQRSLSPSHSEVTSGNSTPVDCAAAAADACG